jgi:dual specificity MAP kinase phosphatase
VWLGPTPDVGSAEEQSYDVLIECSDLGRLNPAALQAIVLEASGDDNGNKQFHLDFPSSGSILAPTWSHAEADGIIETCKWIYHLAHGTRPAPTSEHQQPPLPPDGDGDPPMTAPPRPRRILLHCGDGYTESTMLAVAYHSFATGLPVPAAWLALHTSQRRNCFAYPSDVALLSAITPQLLQASPAAPAVAASSTAGLVELARGGATEEPRWFAAGFDGSFPSRVLEYMYLGNLGHANNPDLLRALGIGQILSVGETAMWRDGELAEWGAENVCIVQGVQDNGIDPLTDEFERCLAFIGTFFFSLTPSLPCLCSTQSYLPVTNHGMLTNVSRPRPRPRHRDARALPRRRLA